MVWAYAYMKISGYPHPTPYLYLYLYNTLKSPMLAFIQRVGVRKVLVSFIN